MNYIMHIKRSAGGGGTARSESLTAGVYVSTGQVANLRPTGKSVIGVDGGLQIELQWRVSMPTAPSDGYYLAAILAASKFCDYFLNHMIVRIGVGYGECGGSTPVSWAVGTSSMNGYFETWAQVTTGLALDNPPASPWKVSAMATLPTSDPAPDPANTKYYTTRAQAKAWAQIAWNYASIDGYMCLNSIANSGYTYSFDGIPIAGKYDALGCMCHEISHILGRLAPGGSQYGANVFGVLDLFCYSAPGVRRLGTGTPRYFSFDNGTTNRGSWWDSSGSYDAIDFSDTSSDIFGSNAPGGHLAFSSQDIIEMAVSGLTMTDLAVSKTTTLTRNVDA